MNKKVVISIALILILSVVGVLLYFGFKKEKNFSKIYLTEKYYVEDGSFIKVTNDQLKELKNENYILYTYNSYCSFPIPCDSIFKEFMETYHIAFVSIPFAEFKESSFYPTIKYAPSIIVVNKQKVVAYLDANADDDLDRYQDVEKLKEWLEEYIYFEREE